MVFEKPLCENAVCKSDSDCNLIGCGIGGRCCHDSPAETVPDEMNALTCPARRSIIGPTPFCAHCPGAIFHFEIGEVIQEPHRAGFHAGKNITQPSRASAGAMRFRHSQTKHLRPHRHCLRLTSGVGTFSFSSISAAVHLEEKLRVVLLASRAGIEQTPKCIHEFLARRRLVFQFGNLLSPSRSSARLRRVKHFSDAVDHFLIASPPPRSSPSNRRPHRLFARSPRRRCSSNCFEGQITPTIASFFAWSARRARLRRSL